MNLPRIALATLAALVAYFIVGSIFFLLPVMSEEFSDYPATYRTGEAISSVMAVGVLGIVLAIGAAATIFARMQPTGRRTWGASQAEWIVVGVVDAASPRGGVYRVQPSPTHGRVIWKT